MHTNLPLIISQELIKLVWTVVVSQPYLTIVPKATKPLHCCFFMKDPFWLYSGYFIWSERFLSCCFTQLPKMSMCMIFKRMLLVSEEAPSWGSPASLCHLKLQCFQFILINCACVKHMWGASQFQLEPQSLFQIKTSPFQCFPLLLPSACWIILIL